MTSDLYNNNSPVEKISSVTKTPALWYNLNSNKQLDSVLWFEKEQVYASNINGEKLNTALNKVKISSRLANIPRRIIFPNGVSLTVKNNDFIDAALANYKHNKTTWLFRIESYWRWIISTIIATGIVIYLFATWGIPIAANGIANLMTQKTLSSISHELYQQLTYYKILQTSQLDEATKTRANNIFTTVLANSKNDKNYNFQLVLHNFMLYDDKSRANAFALPDGTIIASDKLVQILNDEEFTAVIMHEIGHVKKRHGIRSFIQTLGLFTFISFAFSDPSLILTSNAVLLSLKYSRNFESEADCFAYRYLQQKNLPTSLLSDALQKIAQPKTNKDNEQAYTSEKHKILGQIFEVFSTHPATKTRVNLAKICD